jgi:hypothetical protein
MDDVQVGDARVRLEEEREVGGKARPLCVLRSVEVLVYREKDSRRYSPGAVEPEDSRTYEELLATGIRNRLAVDPVPGAAFGECRDDLA